MDAVVLLTTTSWIVFLFFWQELWGCQYFLGVAGILWLSMGRFRLRTGPLFNDIFLETDASGLILTDMPELAEETRWAIPVSRI